MKTILALSILFCAIAIPGFSELTNADLDKIRVILREEIQEEIIESEKRMKEYIDLKIENVNSEFKRIDSQNKNIEGQFGFMRNLFIGVVGIPLGFLSYYSHGVLSGTAVSTNKSMYCLQNTKNEWRFRYVSAIRKNNPKNIPT